MSLFSDPDRHLAEDLFALSEANPFTPGRVEIERRVLGDRAGSRRRSRSLDPENQEASFRALGGLDIAEGLLRRTGERLAASGTESDPDPRELELLENAAIFTLYHRRFEQLLELARRDELATAQRDAAQDDEQEGDAAPRVSFDGYGEFRAEARALLRLGGRRLALDPDPAHLLALFFQAARAFHHIYANLLGTSPAAERLRTAAWESIFTHDLRRYQRSVFRHMHELATLVTGPPGTGKELVARAIGLSGYVPFDEKRRAFAGNASDRFCPLNLTALSPTLIESELFGHRRGAFTGALQDRRGWFELCPPQGAVFLDEIGEIEPEIQLKLLRVLQTRSFQRLGESRPRAFRGKLISATNRDLERAMSAGRFREDLYFRICSDRIVTPSLAEQLDGSLDELRSLALFVARRLVAGEAAHLADEVVEWVKAELGADYAWPGNFRELEQCVRSVLIRRRYEPTHVRSADSPLNPRTELSLAFERGERSAEEMLRAYCTLVYAEQGTFDGAARVLEIDRRTVRAKIDADLLRRLR